MKKLVKLASLILSLCLLLSLLPAASAEVIDADLKCTITLGNWPPDTAAEA